MSSSPSSLLESLTEVANSEFASAPAPTALRVCCYGSSSESTPELYLHEARALGFLLAKRGHTLVNGAGSFGCMAAMNDGADAGNGSIVGVIHEMFLVDGGLDTRDGGAHNVFSPEAMLVARQNGAKRDILVAGGDDLQQRKKLLVGGADALIVLPGGPGTWDELWEMACARNLGMTDLPIVCVSVDGYYDPFRDMLKRAQTARLIKNDPERIVHFVRTAEQAIRWVELQKESVPALGIPRVKQRRSLLNRSSFFTPPVVSSRSLSWRLSSSLPSFESTDLDKDEGNENVVVFTWSYYIWKIAPFVSTLTLGAVLGATFSRPRR